MTGAVNQHRGGLITHAHPWGGGRWPRGLGQLIYSLHPFLILISCPCVSCTKRSQPAPLSAPFFFLKAISSPVTATPYPLSSPPPLKMSLFSARCSGTLPRWPDTSLLSFWIPASPCGGQEYRVLSAKRCMKEIWPQSNADHIRFVLSPTQIMTANSSGQQSFSP